jgi:hypothetical protein
VWLTSASILIASAANSLSPDLIVSAPETCKAVLRNSLPLAIPARHFSALQQKNGGQKITQELLP